MGLGLFQWISSVGQQQDSPITERDTQSLEGRKYLIIVSNAELGGSSGIHWSSLVDDIEAGIASHYNSLPSFKR